MSGYVIFKKLECVPPNLRQAEERMVRYIAYYYRGLIERGSWKEGFSSDSSLGNPLYPWMTKAECRADAKEQGCKAVFYKEGVKSWPLD